MLPVDSLKSGSRAKCASARRTVSSISRSGAARDPISPKTRTMQTPICSAPFARSGTSAPPWLCPMPTPPPFKLVADGSVAALLLDQAGWHTTGKLVVPRSIVLVHLPPKSPELNATENIWQYLRQTWLSYRVTGSHGPPRRAGCRADRGWPPASTVPACRPADHQIFRGFSWSEPSEAPSDQGFVLSRCHSSEAGGAG